MKKVYLFLIVLFSLFITVNVNAYSLMDIQDIIESEQGVNFYLNSDDTYSAYCDNEIGSIDLKLDYDSDINVIGGTSFVLRDGLTIHNVYLTMPIGEEGEYNTKVLTFMVTRQDSSEYALSLDDLQVVGYNLKYNKNKNSYVVNVPSNVDSVYVYAKPVGNATYVEGDGLINLDKKSTDVVLSISNPSLGNSEYNIKIVKKNYILSTVFITSLIFIIAIGILLYYFKKFSDKVSKVDVSVMNKGVNSIDVDSILGNVEKNKGINDIANENIKKGVVEAPSSKKEENK